MTVLVCDLGGTHCRLALSEEDGLRLSNVQRLRNSNFSSFPDLLADYLNSCKEVSISTAVVALAAPVDGDCIVLTNLDWQISAEDIVRQLGGAKIYFINDLEALGYALACDKRLTAIPVLAGSSSDGNAGKLVIGAGTGFNSAAFIAGGKVICSETGHSTFPVETLLDHWICQRISAQHGRCSLDRVLSGAGLGMIYSGVCTIEGQAPKHWDTHKIIPAALAGGDPLALAACNEFCRILGRAAGDLSLIFMPVGGVWLAGGMSLALRSFICDPAGAFATAFRKKGRMSDQMHRFGVSILEDDNAALYGCLLWRLMFRATTRSKGHDPSKRQDERVA